MPTKRFENLEPEKRETILNAARDEFIKKGYERASLNTIINNAGISKGSLYYYFEDKADLYIQVLINATEILLKDVGEFIPGETPVDFWESIHEFTLKMIRMIKKKPDLVKLTRGISLFSVGYSMPQAFIQYYDIWKSWTQEMLQQGQNIGVVRTDIALDLLINILFGLGEVVDMWVFEHWEEFTDSELEDIARLYVDMIKRIAGVEKETQQEEA